MSDPTTDYLSDDEIDFDATIVKRTGVHKTVLGEDGALTRRSWQLRDDIPSTVMARVFKMRLTAEREQLRYSSLSPEELTEEIIDEQFAAVERASGEVTSILLAIFRHGGYTDITMDDLSAWFTHEERLRLVNLFFTRRWNEYRGLPGDSNSAPTPLPEPPTDSPTPEPNRATRRQTSSSKTNGSGAIPSQKHIKRALQGM